MPYIKAEERKKFDESLPRIIEDLKTNGFNEGEMNYVISKIVNAAFAETPRYGTINKIIGMLDCVKMEFFRRKAVPYEEQKIKENGDV